MKDINQAVYEKPEIQDTLKAFGLDSSKFWYLCLFIKWKVDWEFESARVFPNLLGRVKRVTVPPFS
jgi:hypothetical protein